MPTPDQITREDLALFVNACAVGTGQKEFYSAALEQQYSLAFLHEYVCGNYRSLYAHCLSAGINHRNQAEIVFQLLASGKFCPDELRPSENELIRLALKTLPPQRVWKLFERLREAGVNNRRTRATIRDFAVSRKNLAFDAVKYRSKLRSAVIHAHVDLRTALPAAPDGTRPAGELERFLFEPLKVSKQGGHTPFAAFQTPLLEAYRSAHFSQEALYKLPYSVAEVFAARHGIERSQFLKKIEPQMTERERLRLQSAGGGKVALNPARLSLTELCVYLLSLSLDERFPRRAEIEGWLEKACGAVRARPALSGRVAAVLDNSYSSGGSEQRRGRPLALAWAVHLLLKAQSGTTYQPFWTSQVRDDLLVHARGQSNVTERLLDALDWGAETVIIVSDGVENDPAGAFEPVLAGYRRLGGRASIVHLNPVFDAERLEVRRLSPDLPALGLRDGENLAAVLDFARFVSGELSLEALLRVLSPALKENV
ncbi:hypothetical protein [Deinococcus sp.]|uniref:hypothetical protein n=1 Tax=Deinococcus sp. TaxID=47478 RepID=UPI0025DC235F|nr:hypothetical protein [Deinococcus sp.]